MAKDTNLLPYNLEAEQSLLGAILIDKEMQFEIATKLKIEDFFVASHKLIFDAMCSVLMINKPVDVVTLTDEMSKTPYVENQKRHLNLSELAKALETKTTLEKAGGIEYLSELTRVTPSAANYEYYLNIVKRDSTLRKLIRAADGIAADARVSTDSNESVARAEKSIYDISEQLQTTSLTNINENTNEVLSLYENIQNDKNFLQGLNTGFTELDKLTNGLHKGNLVILAARPAVGKTTLVMNIVANTAIKYDSVCAVFALEMTKQELTDRMLCSIAGVSNQRAKKGELSTKEWGQLWDAQKLINKSKIFVDDTSIITVPEILSKCRRLKSMNNNRLDLVIVDHMQLMTAVKSSDSRQSEMTEISRGLKMIAKELDCPVIALSQMSRSIEKRNGGRPVLSDLRESGAIEQDADIVMFIHRPELSEEKKEQQKGKAETEIIVAKNRSGPCDTFKLIFKGEQNKFVNFIPNVPEDPYARRQEIADDIASQNDIEDDSGEADDDVF